MAQVRTGRHDALDQLYHCYFRRGYALARRILSDSGAAEDCVHDVFLKLWQAPHLFDPQRGAFVHWFLAAVHHRALNHLRQRGHAQLFVELDERALGSGQAVQDPGDRPPGQSSVEDLLGLAEIQRIVRDGLARLTPPQRTALELAYFGGMSRSQIAAHIRVPLGTVKTRIRSGMILMRAELSAAHPPVLAEVREVSHHAA